MRRQSNNCKLLVKLVFMSEESIGYKGWFDENEFEGLSMGERLRDYGVMRFGEDGYAEVMAECGFDYLNMLQRIKRERPGDFYRYFHDLLHRRELDAFRRRYLEDERDY